MIVFGRTLSLWGKIFGSAGPFVISPFKIASPYLLNSVSPVYLVILMLLAVPVLHPWRVTVISLLLTVSYTFGAVILVIFCRSSNALLKCFSERLKDCSPVGILPTPSETTNPLCLASPILLVFSVHLLENIYGYLDAPYAQSKKPPAVTAGCSSYADPASIAFSSLSLLPSNLTISAISAYMPKS